MDLKDTTDFTTEESNESTEVSKVEKKGLTTMGAVFFVVGDIVGAGIVTLPYTMRLVSWWGVPLFFMAALLMCLCGILLSKGCLIVFKEVKNREELRDPYPRLAEKAFGHKAKISVIIILNVSLIFTCIVFLLLLGEIFTQFAPLPTNIVTQRNQLRIWFIICAIVLLPLTFLGTPKDFWGIGLLATVCSSLAAIIIVVNIAMTSHKYGYKIPTRIKINPETILAAFGTIQFTFGGIAIFPTIQNDLKNPEKFPIAVIFGYCIVLFIYLGVSLTAFIVLDGKIQEDILTSFSSMPMFKTCKFFKAYVMIAQMLICGHVLCAFVMLVNPVNQQLEALLNAPIYFSWQRIVIRTAIIVLVVVVATVIPNFGPVLSLAGGTLFSLLNVIFPILFYCKLANRMGWLKEVFLALIIIISIATAIGNGYVEIKDVVKVIQGKYEVV